MTIITVQFDNYDKHYDYLLRNSLARRNKSKGEKPIYMEVGTKLKYVRGSNYYNTATVIALTKVSTIPPHVTKYLEIDNEYLEVCGRGITPQIRKTTK